MGTEKENLKNILSVKNEIRSKTYLRSHICTHAYIHMYTHMYIHIYEQSVCAYILY